MKNSTDSNNASDIVSKVFGILVLAIGIINTFWGNDTFAGIFFILLSLVYFLPINKILEKNTGKRLPALGIVKIILGVLILVAALGVGELFDKIGLMMEDLS
jgi:hypothetical protein